MPGPQRKRGEAVEGADRRHRENRERQERPEHQERKEHPKHPKRQERRESEGDARPATGGSGERPTRQRLERKRDDGDRRARRHDAAAAKAPRSSGAVTAREAAGYAAFHVQQFTGHEPEGVTALERGETGWRVGVEVLEARRIPDSTDILAEYRVEVDDNGDLVSYRRDRRYYRGRTEENGA